MIEVEMNQDIRKYEPKLIGPFTTRQIICATVGGGTILFTHQILTPFLTTDITSYVCMFLSIPFLALGWWKPYGMKMEDFAKSAIISLVLAPNVRKFQHKYSYQAELYAKKKSKKRKKRKPSKKYKAIR